jgi:hypothetical protein
MQMTIGGLAVNGIVFFACTVMALIADIGATTLFYLTVTMIVICGTSTAFLQNGTDFLYEFIDIIKASSRCAPPFRQSTRKPSCRARDWPVLPFLSSKSSLFPLKTANPRQTAPLMYRCFALDRV